MLCIKSEDAEKPNLHNLCLLKKETCLIPTSSMAIHYRFGSEKHFNSVQVDGSFISVASLKNTLCELAKQDLIRSRGRLTDDLYVADAQTGHKFSDDSALIPRNASVLIRRLPSRPTFPIVLIGTSLNPNSQIDSPSTISDDFGPEIYSNPSTLQAKLSQLAVNLAAEDSKIESSVETPDLNFVREFGYKGKTLTTPPEVYVCHRCNAPGHFIKDCPTNGDPNYDFRKHTIIPKSKESAFVKEVEGLPSMSCCSVATDHLIPPELHCPLCKQVMKNAVFAKKCCFKSFCYTCIRDHYIASKFVCVCGAGGVLADDLLPNITLRDTISRILESDSSSSSGNSVTSRYRAPDTMSIQQENKKRAASNRLPADDLQSKKARHEGNAVEGDRCPEQPKKQPAHAPEQQQSKKRSMASNGIPASNLLAKKARNEYHVPTGEKVPQVPFVYNQQYWYGQPYIYCMSSGMTAVSSFQLY